MIIILAAAAPTEAEIQAEITRIKNSPEGQEIFNPDLLRERAISNLISKTVIAPDPEIPSGTSFEVDDEPAVMPAPKKTPTQVPTPEPALPTELPKEEDNINALAQMLYEEYQTAEDDRKNDIINEVGNLPYGNSTLANWLQNRMQDKSTPWIMEVISKPNIRDFLKFLISGAAKRAREFKPKAASKFGKYFDERGGILKDYIPRHLMQVETPSEYLFQLVKSRPIGYMGKNNKDMEKALASFDSVDDVFLTRSPDAEFVKQYLDDCMVSEAYKWNRWEIGGKYAQPRKNPIPAGYEGSRTYNAFENLNRIYGMLAPILGLQTHIPKQDFQRLFGFSASKSGDLPIRLEPSIVKDPIDHTKTTRSHRTGDKKNYAILGLMNRLLLKPYILNDAKAEEMAKIEQDLNAKLPPDQQISLKRKDYVHPGILYIEQEMVDSTKNELGPTYVRETRIRVSRSRVLGRDQVSIEVQGEGEEGQATSHQFSEQEKKSDIGRPKKIEKPVLSSYPSVISSGPLAPNIAKEFFPKIKVDTEFGQYEVEDPTWTIVEEIQNRKEELKKILPSTPPLPEDMLIVPIIPTELSKRRLDVRTPEQLRQQDQEMKNILMGMVNPTGDQSIQDPIAYLSDQLTKYMGGGKDEFEFDIKPVAGRYLVIRPVGPKMTHERVVEMMPAVSNSLALLTHDKTPHIFDENGFTSDSKLRNEMVRGYLLSRDETLVQKPEAYKNVYDKYIADQAHKLSREEVVRNKVPELLEKYKIPEEETISKVDKFYNAFGESGILSMLRQKQAISGLLGKAADRLYGAETPLENLISKKWRTIDDREHRIDLLKNSVAHEIAKNLTSENTLDPTINKITQMLAPYDSVRKDLFDRLSQAEKKSNPSLLHNVYKIVSEVMGEMIGLLMREELGASRADVEAAISMLRIVRLAISCRMMTKTG